MLASWRSARAPLLQARRMAAAPGRAGVSVAASPRAAAPTSSTRVTPPSQGPAVLDGISTVILDCDGVIWRGNETVRNAPEALAAMRRLGKRLLFVTNNSSKSRQQYVEKFTALSIEAHPDEIVSSSYAAAAYLQDIGFQGKKVLLLGPCGVEQELGAAAIPFVGGEAWRVPLQDTAGAMLDLQVDPDIGAVVVGWDPYFSYSRLVYASVCLRELPGCLLVATNLDCADNIGDGRMMPGTGGLVAAVEVASGKTAVNVGKGGAWLLPFLCAHYGLQPQEALIVGDRLDTDIALGVQGGLRTVLPLTGVTTMADLEQARPEERPDFVVHSLAALAGLE